MSCTLSMGLSCSINHTPIQPPIRQHFLNQVSLRIQSIMTKVFFCWLATWGWVNGKMTQLKGDLNLFIVITLYQQLHFSYIYYYLNPNIASFKRFNNKEAIFIFKPFHNKYLLNTMFGMSMKQVFDFLAHKLETWIHFAPKNWFFADIIFLCFFALTNCLLIFIDKSFQEQAQSQYRQTTDQLK